MHLGKPVHNCKGFVIGINMNFKRFAIRNIGMFFLGNWNLRICFTCCITVSAISDMSFVMYNFLQIKAKSLDALLLVTTTNRQYSCSRYVLRSNAQMLIFCWLLTLFLKNGVATFDVSMTNHSQDITKKQFQRANFIMQ